MFVTQKNAKSVALTATTALLVLMVIGFGEAFAEMLDAGEWQMTTSELSENSEKYAEAVAVAGQLENVADKSDAIDVAEIVAERVQIDAFDEVIRVQ